MRRRARRDLITLAGVIAIVGLVLFVNAYMRVESLKEAAVTMRKILEQKHRDEGVALLNWEMLRATEGTLRSGARFNSELEAQDGRYVNIVGFMAPIDQFREVEEFMLLPMPIECYFCDSPPPREIVHVKLAGKARMVNEPVLISGKLALDRRKGALFFQVLDNAQWNQAVREQPTTAKVMGEEHVIDHLSGFARAADGTVMLKDDQEKELAPGIEPPTTGSVEGQTDTGGAPEGALETMP